VAQAAPPHRQSLFFVLGKSFNCKTQTGVRCGDGDASSIRVAPNCSELALLAIAHRSSRENEQSLRRSTDGSNIRHRCRRAAFPLERHDELNDLMSSPVVLVGAIAALRVVGIKHTPPVAAHAERGLRLANLAKPGTRFVILVYNVEERPACRTNEERTSIVATS
jgi:hypothetical protein